MACEFDCLSTYACSRPITVGMNSIGRDEHSGAVFSPWILVGLEGDGTSITVGNKSSPPDNHAVVKSLDYGFSSGAGVKLEIIDEEGGSLSAFVNRLSKALCNTNEDYRMFLDFGWVISYCDGSVEMDKASDHGNRLWFLPAKVVMTFEQGKIKYTLEGTDLQDKMAQTRQEDGLGTDDNKIDLKSAIEDMFSENCPHVEDVRFENKDGQEWSFKNSDGGRNGPKSVWTTDQQNALATTRKWLNPVTTNNDKGITFQWKPDERNPCLVLLEDPTEGPDENESCCRTHIATYIVNGGNCSNVLQFSPQIDWKLAMNSGSGGGLGGGTSGESVKAQGRENSRIEKGGIQTQFPANQNDVLWRPPSNIMEEAAFACAAHQAAGAMREIPTSITAELKIIGDPSLAFPLTGAGLGGGNLREGAGLIGRSVSIIVINPFRLAGGASGCEWIANPSCNEILSNKNWMIQGASHQIKEGSYTTTLKLNLVAPNAEINPGEPFGGLGCGTFVPRNAESQDVEG